MKDLRERYARIGIEASEPLVPFRETIVPQPSILYQQQQQQHSLQEEDQGGNLGLGVVEKTTSAYTFGIRMVPLPQLVRGFLMRETETMTFIHSISSPSTRLEAALSFLSRLESVFKKAEEEEEEEGVSTPPELRVDWSFLLSRILCFGSKNVGSNILVNSLDDYDMQSYVLPHHTHNLLVDGSRCWGVRKWRERDRSEFLSINHLLWLDFNLLQDQDLFVQSQWLVSV